MDHLVERCYHASGSADYLSTDRPSLHAGLKAQQDTATKRGTVLNRRIKHIEALHFLAAAKHSNQRLLKLR